MQHILIASDLSEESLRPFDTVIRLAQQWGSRITLLHVVQELTSPPLGAPLMPPITSPELPEELARARKALTKLADSLGGSVPVEAVVVSGSQVPLAINEFAEEHGVDLIAISTHGRTGWRHLALGSVAEAVLRHSEVPVLSFPRGNE